MDVYFYYQYYHFYYYDYYYYYDYDDNDDGSPSLSIRFSVEFCALAVILLVLAAFTRCHGIGMHGYATFRQKQYACADAHLPGGPNPSGGSDPSGGATPPGKATPPGGPPPPPPPPPSTAGRASANSGGAAILVKPSAPNKSRGERQQAAPKIVNASMRIKLEDLSVQADSGWRDVDQKRVEDLVATFERGEYKPNIMSKPAVLSFGGRPKLASDGLRKLCDGKHTIMALQQLKASFDADNPDQ